MQHFDLPVFHGISEKELTNLAARGCMRERTYARNDIIFHAGDVVHDCGVILEGGVHIENIDLWGNRSILSHVGAGQVFAETYALCGEALMVDVVAVEDTAVLFLNLDVLLSGESQRYDWYPKMLRSLLMVSAQKNLALSGRICCTSSKSIRGRLLTYLSTQALKCGSTRFTIPFDRRQMADYLNVDRSALSSELGKMRDEGLLLFHKNSFTLLKME